MLLEIYGIISIFVLAYPLLTIYLAGSIIATGIVYSLMLGGYLNPPNRRRMFIVAFVSSWIITVVFLYGFFSSIFKSNEEE